MLTVSVAPVSARQANVSQNDRDKPKTTVASAVADDRPEQHRPAPLDAIGRAAPSPRSSTNAPTAGAAYSQP